MKNQKIIPLLFIISFPLIIIGALFKLMHWQGSQIMLIMSLSSYALFAFLCLYEIANSKKIKGLEKLVWLIGFIFTFPITAIIYILSARKRIA
ncbi:MAG: hypothetical protein ACI7YS_16135 [Flavobacterium sp.]